MPPLRPMAAPTKIGVQLNSNSSSISLDFDDLPHASEDLSTLFGVATGDEEQAASKAPAPAGPALDEEGVAYTAQQPRVQTLPQPLCLTPPSTSLLASGSTCASPFELDKRRPRSAGGEPHDENADGSNKKSSDDAAEDPLSSKLESEYHAFADSLLV